MRILVAHSFYRLPGGEDRYVRQLVDLLAGNHEVNLVSRINAELGDGPGTALRMMRAPDVRSALRRSIRAFRPDVIHLNNPYPSFGPEVHLAAAESGTPLVQTAHNFRLRCPNGLLFTEGAPCSRCVAGRYDHAIHHGCFASRRQAGAYSAALWMHRFVLRLEDKIDIFVAPSEFVRRRLVEWGIGADRVTVVRNFTIAADRVPPLGDRGLYLGRLSPEKGVSVLLEALKLAGDPPFDIVGGGPAAAELQAKGASLGLANLRFHGVVSVADVPRVIEGARYAVVPSVWDENAPLAVLEVMAAGRPVIATRVGGLPELVGPSRGRLVAPGDVGAIAGAMLAYAEPEGPAERDGAMARSFVVDECSPEAHLNGLEAAYALAAVAHRERDRRRPAAPGTGVPEARRGELAHVAPGAIARDRVPRPLGHVLMVHCYYRDLGGENLSFEAEVRLLRDAGVRVTTYTRDNHELDGTGALGWARAGLRTTWADDAYGELRQLVREERPDVVHFQNTFPLISPAAVHAAHRLGRPTVQALRNYRLLCASGVLHRAGQVCTDCVGRLVPYPAVRHGCYHGSVPRTSAVALMQATHRILGTWTDAVDVYVAPSAFARDQFVRAGLPADRVVVKPNFVHPDPGIGPGDGGYVLYAGRLAPEKGVQTLVEAWTDDSLPPLRIVGEGPLRSDLEALIAARRLDGRVELMGGQRPDRVLELMGAARCVVFPSEWYETFGRVAAEAYACGVPVVASRLGAVAEIVHDGVTGRLFAPGDPRDLAAAVRDVIAPGAASVAMRREARAAFETRYTGERNLERLLWIYELARDHARAVARS